jgi:hypothetical protein
MYTVSEAYKKAISQPSRELRSRMAILGEDIVLDDDNIQSIVFDSAIVAGNDFEIGTAIMGSVDIQLIDRDFSLLNVKFEDKEILVEIAVKLEDETYEYVPLGLFTIEKVTKNDTIINITASDRMYKFEKDYISDLEYPATLLDIAQDICNIAGVELVNTSFPNSSYIVNSKPTLERVTCRKAIAAISELAGGYARITRDGKLEIFNISITNRTTQYYVSEEGFVMEDYNPLADELITGVIECTKDNYINLENKDMIQASIDKVIVILGAEEATRGEGDNPYYIVDNLFCQNPNLVVDELYNVLNGLSYMPFNAKWQGNMAIDCGDMITINPERGYFNTLATSKKLTYRGGLREEYKAVGKSNTEKKSTGKGSLTLDMEKAKTEIKVLDGKIEQRVTKGEFETLVEQTEEALTQKVSRGDDLKTEVTQNAESWKLSFDGKLKGTTYEFTGSSFKIGDTDNGGTAEHTPSYSKYSHSDGSYTKISSNGPERYVNNAPYPYYFFTYQGTAWCNSDSTVTVNLPEEVEGKDFYITWLLGNVGASTSASENFDWIRTWTVYGNPNSEEPNLGYDENMNTWTFKLTIQTGYMWLDGAQYSTTAMGGYIVYTITM